MLISIIVPVYNSKDFLDKCVRSLLAQSYNDIEIILVDDGSRDGSSSLCDEYAEKEPRVRVIHKQNGGLSDARNAGIANACGRYIMLVDSDDYIEPDVCAQFAEIAERGEYDIIAGDAKRIDSGKTYLIAHSVDITGRAMNGREFLAHELKAYNMNMASCFNMYRKDFLAENDLSFEKGLLHEDELFTPRAFLAARKVVSSGINFYNYIIRDDSITTKSDKTQNARDVITICEKLQERYEKLDDEKLKKLLYDHLVNLYLNVFQVARLYKKEHRALVRRDIVRGRGYTAVNKIRIRLFCISPKVYYFINFMRKKLAG
jgi:glycosyltransferase involved in cell wall biosynthesis